MSCSKCNTHSCDCDCKGNYLEVEGCLVTCNPAKLIVKPLGYDESGDVEVPKDPSSLTVFVERPDGTVLRFYWTSGGPNIGIVRISEGYFVIGIFLSLYGRYDVRIQTTGRNRTFSDHFFVEDSGIDCALNATMQLTDSAEVFAASITNP